MTFIWCSYIASIAGHVSPNYKRLHTPVAYDMCRTYTHMVFDVSLYAGGVTAESLQFNACHHSGTFPLSFSPVFSVRVT